MSSSAGEQLGAIRLWNFFSLQTAVHLLSYTSLGAELSINSIFKYVSVEGNLSNSQQKIRKAMGCRLKKKSSSRRWCLVYSPTKLLICIDDSGIFVCTLSTLHFLPSMFPRLFNMVEFTARQVIQVQIITLRQRHVEIKDICNRAAQPKTIVSSHRSGGTLIKTILKTWLPASPSPFMMSED